MALSIVRVLSLTTSQIKVLFTDDLDTNIGISNVSITSLLESIPDSVVNSVIVDNNTLTVNFRPIFSGAQYTVAFSGTTLQPFRTVNGEVLAENDARNALSIISPGESQNDIRDGILDELSVVYESEQPSLIRDLIGTISGQMQTGKDVLDTVKSANYLSVPITNELITRDDGPIDKFNNGGVFEVTRVATSEEGVLKDGALRLNEEREASFVTNNTVIVNSIISSLPADPISLQSIDVINETVSDDINENNFFSGLRIKVSNRPVIQVISVTLNRDGVKTPYNIETFGYTLLDNRYDTTSASRNVNLTDQEIDLSPSSITGISGGFLQPKPGDTISISYIYKKLGRNVDSDSVSLSKVKTVVRESVPALLNTFSLTNAPIVLANDIVPTTGGVTFLNVEGFEGNAPFSTNHPAFTRETAFDASKAPARPGEFSVNYETGEVLVFGETISSNGSGLNPPVADYLFRDVFVLDSDYTFDSDTDELAIRSTSNLEGVTAKVAFNFEDIFAKGDDFRLLSHIEALNERVNNRLIDDFTVATANFPVTDAFRVFNETTGEIYTIDRFNDTSIFFSGREAPKQVDVSRERIAFSRVSQEILLVSDELTNSFGFLVFKIDLSNRGITDTQRNFIAAHFDTSASFSRDDVFIRERFYEDRLFSSVNTNLDRLIALGDYMIDYNNGIIYVAVTGVQNSDIGDILYEHNDVVTKNDHILGVNNIFRSANTLEQNIKNFSIGSITDTTAGIVNLEQIGERFINNNPTRPLLVGSYQNGEDGVTTSGSTTFTSNGGVFTAEDVGRTLRLGSSDKPPAQDVTITGLIGTHQLIVTPAITDTGSGRVWAILDLSGGAAKTITLENNIISVRDIFTVEQLGTLTADELDGYFDINNDSFINNVITLGSSNTLEVGDAVIVVYNFGNIFIDYKYLKDDLVISYEYGNNSLDWSISNALAAGEEYVVNYSFGALRESLLSNFGALTQIPLLTNFPTDFNRETYRSIVGGTLQSFVEGPTVPSIERLVESFTDVTPNITESVFNSWVLGRDSLHLRDIETLVTPVFDLGKFSNGIVADNTQTIQVPAVAHIRINEGTLSTWVRPGWDGLANDADVTFSLSIDEVKSVSNVYIGLLGANPKKIPFTLNKEDSSVLGQPVNINDTTGYFIWFDEFTNQWNLRWRENAREFHDFTGTITTTGEFFEVVEPVIDGNELNELSDLITSTTNTIDFTATIDCLDTVAAGEDAYIGSIDGGVFVGETFVVNFDGGSFKNDVFFCVIDGGAFTDAYFTANLTENVEAQLFAQDGISFKAGDEHYVFDMGTRPDANRISLFKDGTGFLNFQVFDNQVTKNKDAGFFNIASNIKNWNIGDLHHLAVSWKFNSPEEKDFMHLFVDGFEVPNLFKYGGNPKANSAFDFGDIAQETIINSSASPIVGGFDGISESGSDLFRSVDINFDTLGVDIGDSFSILDETPDGSDDPISGGVYTITGVGDNTLTLDRSLTLTLGNIQFTVNQFTKTVDTSINLQDFIVVTIDGYGNETELNGVDATEPDYTVARGANGTHVISLNNGVSVSHKVILKTLGLIFRRCKEQVFVYEDEGNTLRANVPPPISLVDVDVTKITLEKMLVEEGTMFDLIGGSLFVSLGGDGYQSQLADGYVSDGYLCQPSNQFKGRTLAVVLSGDNIDYSGTGNFVVIHGDAVSGATEETIIFSTNDTKITSEFWINLVSIDINIVPINTLEAAGTIEIRESKPMTVSENFGDYVEVTDYSNGIFTFEIFGSGGIPFILESCFYELDYPSFLSIEMNGPPDTFFIGSNRDGGKSFNGTIDEFKIVKTAQTDVRVGEPSDSDSITGAFNATKEFITDNDTILLTHFNDDVKDKSIYLDAFDTGFEVGVSVNSNFGTALLINDDRPFEINNAFGVFNNDAGTIEFWVNPMLDNSGDPNLHYYIDMSAIVTEFLDSITNTTIIVSQRVREIESVRLVSDASNTGTNYFVGGNISNIDGKTLRLGTPLPSQNTAVKVSYVPLNNRGDRVSVFKDDRGFINFFMKASDVEHLISFPVEWKRNTWHRVMVMWKTNSADNQDRLRLFVDGVERGTIKYGTGLIYGTGVIYGQAEVRSGVNRFVVDNIDLTDAFSKIFIGTDTLKIQNAQARIDNIRISNTERLQSINIVGGETIDVNYTANTSFALPVIEDVFTTKIIDFDKEISPVEFFATLINEERGIFTFEVEVIDSFDKVIGNTKLEDLLVDLINTIKPAHTEAIVTFVS